MVPQDSGTSTDSKAPSSLPLTLFRIRAEIFKDMHQKIGLYLDQKVGLYLGGKQRLENCQHAGSYFPDVKGT